jgi:hypothetical protein
MGLFWEKFGVWTSPNFKDWTRITNEQYLFYNEKVEFPEGIRHGAIIGITQEEHDRLIKVYEVMNGVNY